MELFANCPSCAQPTYGEIKQLKGSFISITQDCRFCFYQRTWSSQPLIGSIPAGNFEISCALLFSGSLPSKSVRMFKFLNMASISYRTFMYHQQCYLHPAVTEVWRDQQASYVQEARASGRQLHLGGDGRADTPGHCAKFGSYTLMDLAENVVVDLQLIQSNEVGGSCLMEKEGLIRGVRYLEENGLPISQIVTDRHLQVAKWMRENLPDTTHSIDVWHVAKGFKKKLLALSKEKDCEHLREWIKSLVNHLYWVPSSAPDDEDSELRWEKWTSITNQVQNIHEGHGQHFQRCEHGDLDPAARRKRWLRPGTKVMEKLEAIVNSRQMKKDIPMLSSSFQTSSVEAFHSVINQFAPKMYKFSYFGMQSRLALAALHFNENSSKDQAATREGNLQYSIVFPKHKKGDYTVKKVKTQKYVDVLTNAAKTRASNMKMPQCGDPRVAPPPLCDQYVLPEKDDAVGQLLTRFRRN
ncbi:uncharacterized protein LOC134250245 isoform X2 [Saccostrea cucullata]|uniref:uncharacterized protein LOC134250245 isoform X2 n=2 Tax=Saccostrea cuccullata TaxID=36930 RepID=UPI002ED1A9AA